MKKMKLLVITNLVLLLFASCTTTQSIGSFFRSLTKKKSVNKTEILGSINAVGKNSNVKYDSYLIRGYSDEGDYFDWIESPDSNIILSNITQGHWNLEIKALDAQKNVIAHGLLKKELSETNDISDSIYEEFKGNGASEITYTWDKDSVVNPKLEIYIKGINDEKYEQVSDDQIVINENTAIWTNNNLPGGRYLVKALLQDGVYVMGGAGSSLKVFPSLTSKGDVVISTNSYSYDVDFEKYFKEENEEVTGSLTVFDNYIVCSGDFYENNVNYFWFIDGQEITNNTNTLLLDDTNLTVGNHRIDCVIEHKDLIFSNFDSFIYFDGVILSDINLSEGLL